MTDTGPSAQRTPPPATQSEAKRRKLRKGTRSCWECKRRKNRCTWFRDEGNCDGCRARGTRCISQEFPEETVVAREKRAPVQSDEDRLQRLEALVEELARHAGSRYVSEDHVQLPRDDEADQSRLSIDNSTEPRVATPSSEHLATDDIVYPCSRAPENCILAESRIVMPDVLPLSFPGWLLSTQSFETLGDVSTELTTPLACALIKAWPGKHYYNAILSSDVGSLHPALSSACSGFRTPPSPKDLLQLPPPGATPVAVARQLLALGAYLQVISLPSEYDVTGLGPEYRVISSRAFETVSKLVTHNDSLPGSIGIVECLLIESQNHNYLGNIRRAWLVLRRAVAMAQIIGLDHRQKSPSPNTNEDDAKAKAHGEKVWFTLIHFDQYLSFLLGIFPIIAEYTPTIPGMLETCTPSERMGRLHSMAAGRILQRNHVNIHDLGETKEIDKILRKAADCMAPQWWLPPAWINDSHEGIPSVIDRLMVHFAHYNLLLQAHIPHVLHSLNSKQYYASTPTAINACFEALTRFTTFRQRYPAVSYCRGLDIFTFVASIVLCLLHIYASQQQLLNDRDDSFGISNLLAHQRPSHRGLMEQALQSIQRIVQIESGDKIASGIVSVFGKLLAIEQEAYGGVSYEIHLITGGRQLMDGGGLGSAGICDDALSLDIPFCGTIKVQRADSSRSGETDQTKGLYSSILASAERQHTAALPASPHMALSFQPDLDLTQHTGNSLATPGVLLSDTVRELAEQETATIDVDFFEHFCGMR
ncbi:hypothetical protein F4777DRAFT_362965 [Nemania sp. FL0916]|nr:hypothetical protein F4777DRAFT_362965 [Nemania sp. FL0916]